MEREQLLLRVYLRTTDQHHLSPTYQQVVQRARARKLAGATVLTGIHGFGGSGAIHDSTMGLSQNFPVIVEIVDEPEKIAAFVNEALDHLMTSGIATLERAHVVLRQGRTGTPANLAVAPSIKPLSTIPPIDTQERSNAMQADGLLLRIFIGESDNCSGPAGGLLYKMIVNKAREVGLKGATVLRGSMGFGANSVLHTAKVLELSSDLPIVIEIVDERAKIEGFLPFLEGTVSDGMITMEDVRIVAYRAAT